MKKKVKKVASTKKVTVSTKTAKTNVFAMIAFVLSIVGFLIERPMNILQIVALVLGIMSFYKIRRTREKGRNFAIAAIIISLVPILISL